MCLPLLAHGVARGIGGTEPQHGLGKNGTLLSRPLRELAITAFIGIESGSGGLSKASLTSHHGLAIMRYVELHARSAFTFLEGASLPESLAQVCSERNIPAIALLDRDGVYGAPRLHGAANQYGIKAHIGAEVSITENGNLPVLVESRTGYRNLCRLITTAKLRTKKTSVATSGFGELQNHAEGLICLTGDENGPLKIGRAHV